MRISNPKTSKNVLISVQLKVKIISNDIVAKPKQFSKDFLRDFLFHPLQIFWKHSNFLTRLVKK